MNADLGTDNELFALVEKVKKFDYGNATPGESLALSKALRIIAGDIVARHESIRQAQEELEKKIAVASVAGELAGVLTTLKPRKRSWRNLWR